MNTENKYYTPEIEELHVGYECEVYVNDWNKYIIPDKMYFLTNSTENNTIGFNSFIFPILIKNAQIRTKYLDEKDIESLGWGENNILKNNERNGYRKMFSNITYFLAHYPEKNIIWIQEMKTDFGVTIFKGECKSINELKMIMQFLNIKNGK